MGPPLVAGWLLTAVIALSVVLYWWSWRRPQQLTTGPGIAVLTGGLGAWVVYLGWFVTRMTDVPLRSLHEVFVAYGISVLVMYLIVARLHDLRRLGTLVSPLVLVILVLAMVAYPDSAPGSAADPLAYWAGGHVLALTLGYGGLTVCFLCAVRYLWADRQLQASRVDEHLVRAPSLEDLDRGLYRSLTLGLGFLLVGLAVGGLQAYGSGNWGWRLVLDPNVLGTVVTGLVFGIIYVLRRQSLFTNRRIVHLSIAGFLLIACMFLLMNVYRQAHLFS